MCEEFPITSNPLPDLPSPFPCQSKRFHYILYLLRGNMEILKQIISSVSLAWCSVVLNSQEKGSVSSSIRFFLLFFIERHGRFV